MDWVVKRMGLSVRNSNIEQSFSSNYKWVTLAIWLRKSLATDTRFSVGKPGSAEFIDLSATA